MKTLGPRATLRTSVLRTLKARVSAAWADVRVRVLSWATLAALLVGVSGAGMPVDDYLRALRNLLRDVPPSGETVIIAIDDRSTAAIGEWPWRRGVHAKIIDRLHQAGAKRIIYDVLFTTRTTPEDDRALAGAIRAAGNVWLETNNTVDPITQKSKPQTPLQQFSQHAKLASTRINYSGLAIVRQLSFRVKLPSGDVPSMSAVIADVEGAPGKMFRPDYAVDLSRIPTFSAIDVVQGRVPAAAIRDKNVVIGFARTTTDRYLVPGVGLVNGVYVIVVGAETLRLGDQHDLGWLLPLMIVAVTCVAASAISRVGVSRWLFAGAILFVTAGPGLAESNRIFFDVTPSITMVGAVMTSRAWQRLRQRYAARGDVNTVSGMPNLNALRHDLIAQDAVLVAARIRNFAEISTALREEQERSLVEQIVARLALGARGARIYQGDEGIFVWGTTADGAEPDHLDALHTLFRSPALVDNRLIDLSVNFGIDADSDRELANRIGATLVAADEAATEGLRWKVYDPAKLVDAEWKLSLLGRLDAAIDSGEVWVAYQPQLDLVTGRICGAEALVRWSHPTKGEVSPAEFVVAAEQHDRIDRLTRFVLQDAIRAAAGINARGTPFDIAVNLSARLLDRPGLTEDIRGMLAEQGLSTERLTLEVTESAAMTSGRSSIRTLEELGSLGISVSIDDYGTGFSTLEYLKLIPAAEVKIDRSFIASIHRSASDRLMVRSTIELAHSLDRVVVAEGVETQETLDQLRAMGCDKAQGYLIGKPMPLDRLLVLLRDRLKAEAA